MAMIELSGLIAAGLMGIILGMIGGGGSILTVPILVYLFALPPLVATSYSLAIVGITAAVGATIKAKQKEVDTSAAILFAIPSFAGVTLSRGYLVPMTPDVITLGFDLPKSVLVMSVFGLVMLLSSLAMIRSRKVAPAKGHWFQVATKGFGIGILTGYIGAGGGFLIVPALVVLVGLSMRMAVGTSMLIIALNSLIGFAGDLVTGASVDSTLILKISAIAVGGLFVGLQLSKNINEQYLKRGFGFFVLIVGGFILLDQFRMMLVSP